MVLRGGEDVIETGTIPPRGVSWTQESSLRKGHILHLRRDPLTRAQGAKDPHSAPEKTPKMRGRRVLSPPEESSFLGCILHPGEPPTPQGAKASRSSSGEAPPSHSRGRPCTGMCYRATSCTLWNLHPTAGLGPALRGHLLLLLPPGQIPHPRTPRPSPQCPAGTPSPTLYPAGEDAAPQGPPTNTLRGGGCTRGIPPSKTHPPEDGATPGRL